VAADGTAGRAPIRLWIVGRILPRRQGIARACSRMAYVEASRIRKDSGWLYLAWYSTPTFVATGYCIQVSSICSFSGSAPICWVSRSHPTPRSPLNLFLVIYTCGRKETRGLWLHVETSSVSVDFFFAGKWASCFCMAVKYSLHLTKFVLLN
jgi:hypothetical protein